MNLFSITVLLQSSKLFTIRCFNSGDVPDSCQSVSSVAVVLAVGVSLEVKGVSSWALKNDGKEQSRYEKSRYRDCGLLKRVGF